MRYWLPLRSTISRSIATIARVLPPETAHHLALKCLPAITKTVGPFHLEPRQVSRLSQKLWGKIWRHPIGLAAGFDKDAVALDPLMRLGFSFVELGTVTPKPQAGNPKPRLFRLPDERALINRLGFNSAGLKTFISNLTSRPKPIDSLIGISLGVNRDSLDWVEDYRQGAAVASSYADYLAINVSSPNTPGLSSLQNETELTKIVQAMRRLDQPQQIPLAIKISLDLPETDEQTIIDFCLNHKIDGLIVGNTTISRPSGLTARHRQQSGGLSGKPLRAISLDKLKRLYRLAQGRLPIISVGGIADGSDVYQRLRAGANLVQIYTSFVYGGPLHIRTMVQSLDQLLDRDNLSVAQAIGIDAD